MSADLIKALDAAKASGDISAIIAAADALAKASAAPKRATRKMKDSGIPAYFSAIAKAKNRIKHSLAVEFADGQTVRVNAWNDPGKPIAIGRALMVAIRFIRHRRDPMGGWNRPVAEIASARLVEGPESGAMFDPAECSALTAEWRAALPTNAAAPSVADRAEYLDSLIASTESLVEKRKAALVAENTHWSRQWMRDEGARFETTTARDGTVMERSGIEAAWPRAVAQCEADIRSAEMQLARYRDLRAALGAIDSYVVESGEPTMEPAPVPVAHREPDPVDHPHIAESDASPYVVESGEPMCIAHCMSHKARERLLGMLDRVPSSAGGSGLHGSYHVTLSEAESWLARNPAGGSIRFTGMPRKRRVKTTADTHVVASPAPIHVEASPAVEPDAKTIAKDEWLAAMRAKSKARHDTVSSLVAIGKPVRFRHPDGRMIVTSPDLDNHGDWRNTFIDGCGPSGHMVYPSLEYACNDAILYGFRPIEKDAPFPCSGMRRKRVLPHVIALCSGVRWPGSAGIGMFKPPALHMPAPMVRTMVPALAALIHKPNQPCRGVM